MIKWIIGIAAAFVVIALSAIGISSFLTPNDLAACESKPTNKTGCRPVDAIIAVSGGDTAARAESAIDLYKKGWAKLIIFSGAAADPNSPSNAAVMRTLALKAGVPDSAILIENDSANTKQNAQNTAKILASHKINSAIITTSPYHERRAMMEFRYAASGVSFYSKPAVDHSWDLWFLRPTGWWRAFSELISIGVLSARGSL